MIAWTDELLVVPAFDPDTHTYWVDGRHIRSVTGVINRAGIGHSDETESGYTVREDVMEAARDRGTDAHKACEYLDEGDLDLETLDEDLLPYVEGYQRWKDDTGFVPDLIEHSFYCAEHDYCGTFDRAGWIGDRRLVVDLKTSTVGVKEWHGVQLAAYGYVLKRGDEWPERMVLEIGCKTKKGYRERPFSSKTAEWHWTVFQAALTLDTFKGLARKAK